MSNYDPLSPFVQQMQSRQIEIEKRLETIDVMDAEGTRRFLDAKLEMDRVNWAGKIGLQLRHGLLKKVTSKI
ncbi:hypothetical protein SAMN05216359_10252 [Roseateles sp. YR242]|uniref:hypothetical protein n=1 Tax=Roseateles sp. YR242 TaxID=1855305 RepID=UPI0008CA5F14|nr:hypothetical protein [Roseateles sp. YR242]SEK51675.1 hypothetical protein SAMN05216359_10252 [Roseateles sp. YR242]